MKWARIIIVGMLRIWLLLRIEVCLFVLMMVNRVLILKVVAKLLLLAS